MSSKRKQTNTQRKLCKALGARFKEVRLSTIVSDGDEIRKVSLGQPELAKAMKRSLRFLRMHESGERLMRVDDLVNAARYMGVDPATLLDLSS